MVWRDDRGGATWKYEYEYENEAEKDGGAAGVPGRNAMKAQRRCAAAADSCSIAGYDWKCEAGSKKDCENSSGGGQLLRSAAAAAAASSRQ